MKILIVVDMQKDFVDGTLGTAEARTIVDKVRNKIIQCGKENYTIIYTMDTHTKEYPETYEGRKLPVSHCIKGEDGWMLTEKIAAVKRAEDRVYEKNTFGSTALGQDLKKIESEIEEIQLVGLCTDICVISNALLIKAFLPETEIVVDSSCCAGVTSESHNNALKAMEMCQVTIK